MTALLFNQQSHTDMEAKLPWLFLLHIIFPAVQLCEIPGGNFFHIKSLNAELLKLTEETSKAPNPSIYLALRLSDAHSLEKERQYLKRLKDVFKPSTSQSAVRYQKHPGTGQLALYLLALRATCYHMETSEDRHLVTQLKLHLDKEKKQIGPGNTGHPITSYYQYSLGVLALCVNGKKIDPRVIDKLLLAEQNNKFVHNSKLSVDTEAVAGLAFVCLREANPELRRNLGRAVQRVKGKILRAQTPEGAFGNIYSTPLAVQFLIASGLNPNEPECPKGVAALLQSLQEGKFQNALMKSQLLPVLHGKSYLDAASKECQAETESLDISTLSHSNETSKPSDKMINVYLNVERLSPPQTLYRHRLRVPQGSTLLDVLKDAKKAANKPFTFKTQDTLSGPMLTEVMGVEAQEGEHKYWKLYQAPNTVLEQGIAEYVPQNAESILLKFVPW
uniref:Transcobalamin-2 n=1 Tax=Salvator merianae TaxID=96440 RepID=A0A8D0KHN4_SALMN